MNLGVLDHFRDLDLGVDFSVKLMKLWAFCSQKCQDFIYFTENRRLNLFQAWIWCAKLKSTAACTSQKQNQISNGKYGGFWTFKKDFDIIFSTKIGELYKQSTITNIFYSKYFVTALQID